MYIEKLKIKSFGRLSNVEFELSPTLNLFEGDNETGKTTVASFIKFMLYGLSSKTVGGDISERKKYISWQSGAAAGSMSVLCADGTHILIERAATEVTSPSGNTTYRERVKMINIVTGEEVFKGEVPGEALLGVPEEVFVSTAFIRQQSGPEIDGGKLSSAAENLLFSADESVSADAAISKLDSQRRSLLHKNGKGGRIHELECEKEELGAKLERAKADATGRIALEGLLEGSKMNLEDSERERGASKMKSEIYEAVRNLSRFDELHKTKGELAELNSEMETFVKDNTVNGNYPSGSYVDSLLSSSNSLKKTREEKDSASSVLDAIENDKSYSDMSEFDELLDDETVAEDIIYDVEKKHRNKVSFTLTAILCLLMMGGCVGAGYYLADTITAEWQLLCLGAGVLFGVFAIIMTIAAAVSSHGYHKLLKKYGAKSNKDIDAAIESIIQDVKESRVSGDRFAEAEALLEVKRAAYDDECERAKGLIYARHPEYADDDVEEALSKTLSECEKIYAEAGALSVRIDDKKRRIEEIKSMTEGANEKDVRFITSNINISEYEALKADDLKKELTFTSNRSEKLKDEIHKIELKLTELGHGDDPSRLEIEYEALESEIAEQRQRYDATLLAIDALSQAGRTMRESVAPRLKSSAKDYLSGITCGRYGSVMLDASFRMTIEAEGAYREVGYLSGGTSDCAYLSLRIALSDLLYEKEMTPLIFDEVFAETDDERTTAALTMLSSSGKQVILFTCRKREGELIAENIEDDGQRRLFEMQF